jgi:hypothetical protein
MLKRLYFVLILFIPVVALSQNIDIRLLRSFNSPAALPSDNLFKFLSNSDAYKS